MLEITNLRAGYGAINVLWDLSLSVAPGKLTTIIGPNGAGKTTLLRAIMGLIPVSQGADHAGRQAAERHADLEDERRLDGDDSRRPHGVSRHDGRGKPDDGRFCAPAPGQRRAPTSKNPT